MHSLPMLSKKFTSSSRDLFKPIFAPQPKTQFAFSDDIDCAEWLTEVDMAQYAETFLTNLSRDGRIILRRRLVNIRQQDLAKMNITDFDHQKVIMSHIKLVLKHPFNSTTRKHEVQIMSPAPSMRKQPRKDTTLPPVSKGLDLDGAIEDKETEDNLNPSTEPTTAKTAANLGPNAKSTKEKQAARKQHAKRRRSFDSTVWQQIATMRTKGSDQAEAAANLREGILPTTSKTREKELQDESSSVRTNGSGNSNRRRRWSFDPDGAANGAAGGGGSQMNSSKDKVWHHSTLFVLRVACAN